METMTTAPAHTHVYTGSRTASVTDMANAGKRGKKCRAFRFQGISWDVSSTAPEAEKLAYALTGGILWHMEHEGKGSSFDEIRSYVTKQIEEARAAGVPSNWLSLYDEEVRGIDAPRAELGAGVAGKWSALLDGNGLHIRALDDVNEWTEITHHKQTHAQAYNLAAKVWPQVEKAQTMREAVQILEAAGCRLHGYCGLD